jgi:hypothetical protein
MYWEPEGVLEQIDEDDRQGRRTWLALGQRRRLATASDDDGRSCLPNRVGVPPSPPSVRETRSNIGSTTVERSTKPHPDALSLASSTRKQRSSRPLELRSRAAVLVHALAGRIRHALVGRVARAARSETVGVRAHSSRRPSQSCDGREERETDETNLCCGCWWPAMGGSKPLSCLISQPQIEHR